MSEERLYTFNELLERLMITDEELLLCKQHRDYNKRLDELLDNDEMFDDERIDIIGQNGNDGLHYTEESERKTYTDEEKKVNLEEYQQRLKDTNYGYK